MATQTNPASIYQLKVTLRHIKPPIWRRLQVKGDITLYKLHYVLQYAMGWTDSHLHLYVVDGTYYGEPDQTFGMNVISERSTTLSEIAAKPEDRFVYEYDFGDGWAHDVVVEDVLNAQPEAQYPRCLEGKRSCPPEDIGGPGGYAHFLHALSDSDHPEHAHYMGWIGGSFDPEALNLKGINDALKHLQ